jgi:hypothetical protein
MRWPWMYRKYRAGAAVFVRYRRENGVGFPAAWTGWESAKNDLNTMKLLGEGDADIKRLDAVFRAKALVWQDAQDPEYFMRRVMAWWMEVPPDYWKLEQLEDYARSRAARKEGTCQGAASASIRHGHGNSRL